MPTSNQTQNSDSNTDLEKALGEVFGVSGSDDDELLSIVDKHTMQLDGDQVQELMWLYSLNNPFIERWVDKYLDLKHHNKSADIILGAVNAISLKNFISQFRFNVNTTK